MSTSEKVKWQLAKVSSPNLSDPILVVAAKDVPYVQNANRLQTLSIYLPQSPHTTGLINTPVTTIPTPVTPLSSPVHYQVHIHGGAWRDPDLTSSSIEPAITYAFSTAPTPLSAIISINYTVSPFPFVPDWLPTTSYDPDRDNHSDPAREAQHPDHVRDVLSALDLLRGMGLKDGSFVLTGHSAGACLAMQTMLQAPQHFGLDVPHPPCPAAVIGLNGLYDLPALVYGLGPTHEHLSDEYRRILNVAFGSNEETWATASPALFDVEGIKGRLEERKVSSLVLLDQSEEDQLVPMNQRERLEILLGGLKGLRVVLGKRCKGLHAAPWEEGAAIWESVVDVLKLLEGGEV